MKGEAIPNTSDLVRAFERLQFEPEKVGADSVVLWAQWSRLDPRLGELVVRFLHAHFASLNPFFLWQSNCRAPCPQSLAVLVDFAQYLFENNSPERRDFLPWRAMLLRGLRPVPPQMFFVPQGFLRPERLLDQMTENLKPYAKWGFICETWIASPKKPSRAKGRQKTLLSPEARHLILHGLIDSCREITVEKYLQACEYKIHRRTAERDLRATSRLRAKGFTRARVYVPLQPT